MSATPAFRYTHHEHENAVIQDLTRWGGETDGMETVQSEWFDHASGDHIDAAVTEFGPEIALGPETQAHIAREWSDLAGKADLDRIAFVSDGVKARAVSANLDVDIDIRAFGSMAEATEWATA